MSNMTLSANNTTGDESLEGRWDITVTKGDKKLPSWLEVNHSGIRTLTGSFVADGEVQDPFLKLISKMENYPSAYLHNGMIQTKICK